MRKNDTPMSYCMRLGYKIIPEQHGQDWYINVYKKGQMIRPGKKSVGRGPRLTGKEWSNAIETAYEYYSELEIKRNNEKV